MSSEEEEQEQDVFDFGDYVRVEREGGEVDVVELVDIVQQFEEQPTMKLDDDTKEKVHEILSMYNREEDELYPYVTSYKDIQRSARMTEFKKDRPVLAEDNERLIKSFIDIDLSKFRMKIRYLNNKLLARVIDRIKVNNYESMEYDELRYIRFIKSIEVQNLQQVRQPLQQE
jgi:hypothetical protein